MTPPFDFGQFEKEAAKLLSDIRRSAEGIAAFESDLKAGRVSNTDLQARAGAVESAAPSGGLTEAEIRARGTATDELAARQRALTAAEQESAQAERVMAQVMAQNGAATRNAGALTNEFVESAKRGEITVRELGQEVAGTIAKFGGWIIAGGAVYFAFNALSDIKRGAVDATSGVQQMSRVINNLDVSSATKEIRELAREFNLPINTVTETAFGIGKAYHNQSEALLATKAALYAVKVGELDAGTATKYLISIINGFHLPASQMGQLFDQLLVAQKRYAIDLPSLMAGVGRAAGSFRAAGGDVHTLIALITTLQHVSGQAGNVIGTAIQRSPHFISTPKNEAILKQFGIDPSADIETIYKQAFEAAQGQSGKVQREIAEGLFGPQYASRVGIFLLQNRKLYEEVFHETAPKQAKGTANEQLQITLGKTSEQIGRIGNSLERLGSELAEGHFLDSLGLGLHLLDSSLETVDAIVEAFNKLPGGVQQSLAYLIQVSLILKAMRRLNVGESIAGGPGAQPGGARGAFAGFFGHESPESYAKLTRKAFIAEEEALLRERGRLGTQLYRGQRRETLALGAAGAANEEYGRAIGLYGANSPEALAAQRKLNLSQQEVASSQQANLALALDEQAATERLAAVQASIAATRKRVVGGLDAEATIAEAERLGYPIPPGFARGRTARPITLGRQPLPSQLRELEAMKALEARGLVPPAVTEETVAATAATAGATREVSGLGTKLGGLSGGFSRMGSAFSTLLGRAGELVFAAFTIGILSEQLVNAAESVGKSFEDITANPESAKGRLEKVKKLRTQEIVNKLMGGESFTDLLTNTFTETTDIGGLSVPTLGLGPGKGIGEEREEVEALARQNIEQELQLQRKAHRQGKPVPFRYVGAIINDIERVKKSGKSRAEINEALDKYEAELVSSANSPHHNQEIAKAQQLLNNARVDSASGKDLVEALQALQSKDISKRLQEDTKLFGAAAGSPINEAYIRKASLTYQALAQRIGKTTDPEQLAELATERQQLFTAVEQAISSELQYQIDFARTPGQRTKAYAQAFSRYRNFSASSDSDVRKQRAAVEKLEAQQEEERQKRADRLSHIQGPGITGKATPGLTKSLKDIEKQLDIETQKLHELEEQQSQKSRFFRDVVQKLREQEFQANSALRQAQEGAREALSADPIRQTEEKLRFIGREIDQAIKVFGRDSQQVYQLISEQRQARQQLVQDQLGLLQARGSLETAGIIQQVPKERATLNGANGLKAQLAYAEAHRGQFDPKAIIELQAQVRAAEAQLAFDVVQEATQLADARFGIREARAQGAGHSAAAAKIAVEKAKYDLAHAQTPLEKLSAQQNLVQALSSKRDAVAQARLETINFEASIAKITTQEEITQLETLLHTYKLSLTARRQLREQIHSLKGQLASEGQGFDLNVGDFALPTAYDIRRAVLGGVGGRTATVNQTNHFDISGSDPKAVGSEVAKALGGAAESAARSAGVA